MEKEKIVVIVCVVYSTAMILIGVIAVRRNKAVSDYLVAGRKLNVTMTAMTLVAVQIGVGIVLSGATNGYDLGVWPGMYCAFGCDGGLIITGLATIKKPRGQEDYVPLDYFAQRYGGSKTIHLWAWISNVPSPLGTFTAQLLVSSGTLAGFGVPLKIGVVVTAVVILIYCTAGGMWGVVLIDVAQTAIIVVGVPILAAAILIQYMGIRGSAGEIFTAPFISAGMGLRFVYLILPFLLLISASYDAYLRTQPSKDAKTARVGRIIGDILVIIIGGFCSTIGVAARSLFPGVTDGIFTIVATGALPPAPVGIAIAAILVAITPSANCVILPMGASPTRDFYNKFLRPEVDNLDDLPKSKLVSQATVFVGSLAGVFFAFHITGILDVMITFSYSYTGSLLILLLGGLAWKGTIRKGVFVAAIAGDIVGVVSSLLGTSGPLYGKMNTGLSLMITYLISAVFPILFSMADRRTRN